MWSSRKINKLVGEDLIGAKQEKREKRKITETVSDRVMI